MFYAGEDGKYSLVKEAGCNFRGCVEWDGNWWWFSKSYIHPRKCISDKDLPKEIQLYLFLLGEEDGKGN